MKMIDVGEKPKTERVAVATGFVSMSPSTVRRIRRGEVEKGDVLAAARLAGVMAAKKTPDLVPLCHPIALSGVDVTADPGPRGVAVSATVRTVDRTGVEMEALTAVCAACLTIYDMLKRYEKGMIIGPVALEEKKGGRSGHWLRDAAATPARRGPRAAARTARRPAAAPRSRRTRGE
jgi:cyclic pyranopterin monophosphate synthase